MIEARRGVREMNGPGTIRRVVERTLNWPHRFRGLHARWERRGGIHQALLTLAAGVVCLRKPEVSGL